MSLDFFNSLSATLDITLTEPTQDIAANLSNQRATSTARIAKLTLAVQVYANDEQFRTPTAEELDQPALMRPEVTLRGLGDPVPHQAPNGHWFTVGDLLTAVTDTERATRHQKPWLDGIDVHHIFFEGIEFDDNGLGQINWGS